MFRTRALHPPLHLALSLPHSYSKVVSFIVSESRIKFSMIPKLYAQVFYTFPNGVTVSAFTSIVIQRWSNWTTQWATKSEQNFEFNRITIFG